MKGPGGRPPGLFRLWEIALQLVRTTTGSAMRLITRNAAKALLQIAAMPVFMVFALIAGFALPLSFGALMIGSMAWVDKGPLPAMWAAAAVVVAYRNAVCAVFAIDRPSWRAAAAYLIWSAAILVTFVLAWEDMLG